MFAQKELKWEEGTVNDIGLAIIIQKRLYTHHHKASGTSHVCLHNYIDILHGYQV